MFHANGNQKKAGGEVSILISNKRHIKTKTVRRNKEGHHIIKESSQHKGITIINIYTSNIGVHTLKHSTNTNINIRNS